MKTSSNWRKLQKYALILILKQYKKADLRGQLFCYHLAIYCISLTIAYAHRTNIAQIAAETSHFLYLLVSLPEAEENMYHNQQTIITIVKIVHTAYVAETTTSCAIDVAV